MVKPYCLHNYESNYYTIEETTQGDTLVTEKFVCSKCGMKKVNIKANNKIGFRVIE